MLEDPVAVALLRSRQPAHLAYTWPDGSPRVVPIWFQHAGDELVLGTLPRAPKLRALHDGDTVAVTIDSPDWPYRVLSVRGPASVAEVPGVLPEYAAAARRYLGEEQGRAWIDGMPADGSMWRIAVRPVHVSVLDFETRFPSAVS